jgi:hypothetical protein
VGEKSQYALKNRKCFRELGSSIFLSRHFFLLWILTRLEENGWPKIRGVLRKRKVYTEAAFINATQDAIRIAIIIGSSLPEVARAIAISFVEHIERFPFEALITKRTVEEWVDKSATIGERKMTVLSDILPEWLRFCSITVKLSNGDVEHLRWIDDTHKEYDENDGYISDIYVQSITLAGIAMCWAYKHASEAKSSFTNPDAIKKFKEKLLYEVDFKQEGLQEMLGSQSTYSSWLNLAEMLVSKYSEEVGFLKYEDLP